MEVTPRLLCNRYVNLLRRGGRVRDIGVMNRALMSRHIWRDMHGDRSFVWVHWINHVRLREQIVWTVNAQWSSWGWRKLILLHSVLLPFVDYRIGDGSLFPYGSIHGTTLGH